MVNLAIGLLSTVWTFRAVGHRWPRSAPSWKDAKCWSNICFYTIIAILWSFHHLTRPKTANKLWSRGKFICKMSRGEKDDKGTGEVKYCRKGERVSYCQERRMGNGHMDGWRLISSLQWFRWGGGSANFVPPSAYLLLPLDTDNTDWIWNTSGEKVTFSICNHYLILASSGQ